MEKEDDEEHYCRSEISLCCLCSAFETDLLDETNPLFVDCKKKLNNH